MGSLQSFSFNQFKNLFDKSNKSTQNKLIRESLLGRTQKALGSSVLGGKQGFGGLNTAKSFGFDRSDFTDAGKDIFGKDTFLVPGNLTGGGRSGSGAGGKKKKSNFGRALDFTVDIPGLGTCCRWNNF